MNHTQFCAAFTRGRSCACAIVRAIVCKVNSLIGKSTIPPAYLTPKPWELHAR